MTDLINHCSMLAGTGNAVLVASDAAPYCIDGALEFKQQAIETKTKTRRCRWCL